MQIKRIMCTQCRAVLDVKNKNNEAEMRILCPSCKSPIRVKFDVLKPASETVIAKTFVAPSAGQAKVNDGATQLGGSKYGATQLVSDTPKTTTSLLLSFNGETYQLKDGKNIIGRKGVTSQATVQIATEDRYMSRQHCIINVSTLPDGTKKAVLSNYLNKNQTAVNGQSTENGDEIRLTDGDKITMGHTTITFKQS